MLKSIVDNIDDKENIFPIELNKEFKIFKVKSVISINVDTSR